MTLASAVGDARPPSPEETAAERPASRASLVVDVALVVALAFAFGRFLLNALAYLRSPYSRDPVEGCVLAIVQLLDTRGNPFVDMHGYPYTHLTYPPLFPMLVWPGFHFFGPSLFLPRLLATLATLGVLAMVFGIVRAVTGSRRLALGAAGVAIVPWFLQTWAPTARVDMLAILLSLGGVQAFLRGTRLPAVFSLFWLGFYSKQNALVAPAAVLLSIARSRGPGRFVRAALGFAVPLAASLGLLALATDGAAWRHLVVYTAAAGYEWHKVAPAYAALARVSWPLLAIVFVALARDARALTRPPVLTLALYWLLSLASLVSVAKEGSGRNYLYEPWLTTVLLAAAVLPVATAGRLSVPLSTAVLLTAALAGHLPGDHRLPLSIQHPQEADNYRRLWAVVRDTEGPILSENLAPLVIYGKPVLVEPYALIILKRERLVHPVQLMRDCEDRVLDLVVAEGLLDAAPDLGPCLAANYHVAETIPPYRLLRPNANAGPPGDQPTTGGH